MLPLLAIVLALIVPRSGATLSDPPYVGGDTLSVRDRQSTFADAWASLQRVPTRGTYETSASYREHVGESTALQRFYVARVSFRDDACGGEIRYDADQGAWEGRLTMFDEALYPDGNSGQEYLSKIRVGCAGKASGSYTGANAFGRRVEVTTGSLVESWLAWDDEANTHFIIPMDPDSARRFAPRMAVYVEFRPYVMSDGRFRVTEQYRESPRLDRPTDLRVTAHIIAVQDLALLLVDARTGVVRARHAFLPGTSYSPLRLP